MDEQIRLALLKNLMNRMEYNEKQKNWTLKGPITADERESLNQAVDAYNKFAVKLTQQK